MVLGDHNQQQTAFETILYNSGNRKPKVFPVLSLKALIRNKNMTENAHI